MSELEQLRKAFEEVIPRIEERLALQHQSIAKICGVLDGVITVMVAWGMPPENDMLAARMAEDERLNKAYKACLESYSEQEQE